MRIQTWPPSFRQRTFSILMVSVVAAGYRRWLPRPWQMTIRDYMVMVAVSAAGLVLSGFPTPMILFITLFALAVYTCLNLTGHGFSLADITTLLAIILLTAAIMLPAMERTRIGTLGKSFFPIAVPARYTVLLFGPE
jgi:hypothetical protein